MSRGLTMLETLVSLALLTVVMLTAGSWIRVVGVTGTRVVEPARWEASARAALQLIQDDLLVGDREPNGKPRVKVEGNTLDVRTRLACDGEPAGMLGHQYRLVSNELRLSQRDPAGAVVSRRVLGGVRSFDCALDDESGVLAVTIVSEDEVTVTRSYRAP